MYTFPQLFILKMLLTKLQKMLKSSDISVLVITNRCTVIHMIVLSVEMSCLRKVKSISSFAPSPWLQNLLLDVNYSEY